ncbi:MAG: hypothetical protein EOS27_28650 [Mesorhizobium sp.]|nr:MAG: hypothetical protein EOS27_28650 [Mesorhizobium sp.]
MCARGGRGGWFVRRWRDSAPLCPAGHLPLKGGDWQFRGSHLLFKVKNWRKPKLHPISPLEGEMSGRTEGGAVPPAFANAAAMRIR